AAYRHRAASVPSVAVTTGRAARGVRPIADDARRDRRPALRPAARLRAAPGAWGAARAARPPPAAAARRPDPRAGAGAVRGDGLRARRGAAAHAAAGGGGGAGGRGVRRRV